MEQEDIDDDIAQPSGNMISIAIAVLAIVLGTAGLYFGFTANKRLNSIDTSIQESTTSAAETEKLLAFFKARIAEYELQISDQAKIINRLRAYTSENEKGVKKLTSELNANREQIIKTAKQLNAIKAGGAQTKVVSKDSKQRTAGASNNSNKPQTGVGTGRTYVIVSGDSFSKIANQFGVSLQSILDANPNADPRRLAIGQKIIIPAN